MARPPASVLFATDGRFSAAVLGGLIQAGLAPAAVVLPAPAGALFVQPAAAAGTTTDLAGRHHLPVFHLPADDPTVVAQRLAALAPELGIMACFPRALPMALAGLPALGTVNVHPSPLPRYRGPAPLFWQLRDGVDTLWVTLHRVTAGFDAGEVLGRRSLALPVGAGGGTLDRLLAAAGVAAVAELVAALQAGPWTGEPQDEAAASYQPWPTAADFMVDTAWSAGRAFAFMRGTADWGLPYRVAGVERELWLDEAVACSAGEDQAAALEGRGNEVRLRMSPGVLEARLAAQ